MNPQILTQLSNLFKVWTGKLPESLLPLPQSGSDRVYYRLSSKEQSAIAAYNPNEKENIAFIEFTEHFYEKGLPVPKVLVKDLSKHMYLLEDLGNETLYDYVSKSPGKPDEQTIDLYKLSLTKLVDFQTEGHEGLNYQLCFPRDKFDKKAMMWDLNYFKYYYLKLAAVPYDEQLLENDFEAFTEYLLAENCDFFMYRDFQSRNVMIKDGAPYFIDYQGGRKGALQYDVASMLYQSKAQLPQHVRDQLFEHYIDALSKKIEVDRDAFTAYFYGYMLIRILQVLGAYGFRGYYEKKVYFIQSIPPAIENLRFLFTKIDYSKEFPELWKALSFMLKLDNEGTENLAADRLNVSINSFSYKKGIPQDPTANGGGFVFDCRILPNPGRLEPYKKLTGRDKPVIDYLEDIGEVEDFVQGALKLARQGVGNYSARNFNHIMFSFGCTGGQHRSVYSADRLASYLSEHFPDINIILKHREQNF